MKKMITVLLCILLAMGSVTALAEGNQKDNYTEVTVNGAFYIRGLTPEGYRVDGIISEGMPIMVFFASEDPLKPYFSLIINFKEEFAGVERLNDMGEADRKILLSEDPMVNPEYTVMKTDFDTEVMVLRSADPEEDFASFVTLYKGYEVGLNLFPGEGSTESLTEDQIALAMKFLSDLDFVPFGAE